METNQTTLTRFTIAYALLGIAEVTVDHLEYRSLMYALKPLLMIVLGWYFYSQTKASTKFFKFILFGIIFSWGGDVFLMFQPYHPLFFVAGLGSFLIAHIFYVLAFINNIRSSSTPLSASQLALGIVPFLIFSASFFYFIKDGLGDMLVPVAAYTIVISLMGITASLRGNAVNKTSYIWVLIGAVLFIMSDSTIALSKFVFTPEDPLPFYRVIIMALYITAQYLIAVGSIKVTKNA